MTRDFSVWWPLLETILFLSFACPIPRFGAFMKKIFITATSGLITAALLYFILSQNQGIEWRRILYHLKPSLIFLYLGLYGLGLFLRTFRYQLLLKSGQAVTLPSFLNLALVTSVRNMLVDFFPARAGSLSYIVLLNRAFRVDLTTCLSSFAYAFLFDQLAMGPLLALTILAESLTSHEPYPWLWGLALVILAGALLLVLSLGPLIRLLSRWLSWANQRWRKYTWLKTLDRQFQDLSQSFSTLRQASIFWPILGISFLIRAAKYLYLYLLLTVVLQALSGHWIPLPFWVVLLGLVASEASAGLPISGLAGFGFYEGVLGAVLSTQGIHPSQAVLVSFAMHFITQIVDYSLGGGALLFILIRWGGLKKKERMLSS